MITISTPNAPAAIGPYSQAVRIEDFLFLSGQLGIDPGTGKLVGDDTKSQTIQVFKNIKCILAAAEVDISHVVKTTVFLTDLDEFASVNEVYAASFGAHKPARSTVQVARLPMGAAIEVECIASYK